MSYRREADVAVVGCGPAGIAAGIQLTRSGVDCLVFEKHRIGGLLSNANLVENYPGFPDGIRGVDLASLMETHLRASAVRVIPLEVSGVALTEGSFTLITGGGDFRSRMVIAATGTRPLTPDGVVVEKQAAPKVLHEIASIMDVHDSEVVIVGAGDAAFDYALNLGRYNKVTLLNRTDRTRCLATLRDRAESLESITYLSNTFPTTVVPAPHGRVSVGCRSGGDDLLLDADHVVFAIGREPELDFLSGLPPAERERLKEDGLLRLVGDVIRGRKRQTAIAVGDGVRVAIEACERLKVLVK